MELQLLAAEMIAQAKAKPMLVELLIQERTFTKLPSEFRRTEIVNEFGLVHVQYSHDQLSARKHMRHLSFSREDGVLPSVEMVQEFKEAFFGNNDVIELPSLLPYVVQMGVFDVQHI